MKISKVIYGVGMGIGFVCMMADHIFWGLGVMFLGLMISVLADPEFSDYTPINYNTKVEKKSYYKDEFEEYKHYEFINKKGIYK